MIKSYIVAASAAVALAAFSTSPAAAAQAIICDNPANASSCSFFHNFGASSPDGEVAVSPDTDTFLFSILGLKTLSGSLFNFFPGNDRSYNVNFISGPTGSRISGGTLAAPKYFTGAAGNPDIRNVGPVTLGAGTYTVTVRYSTGPNGFYNGALNLASAIPEPASWALMILGFGLIGGAMRTRKANKPTLAAA